MKIIIQNEMSEIGKLNRIIEQNSEPWGLSMRDEAQLSLVMDELLSNIIKYAFADNEKHSIEIHIDKKDDEILIKVIDDGIEFNPIDFPEPDLNPVLAERQIGGLGIHIIKNMTSEFSYLRKDGCNVQIISKILDY